MRRILAISAFVVLVALGWQSPATAHNTLVGAEPEDGATMEQGPEVVSLQFLSTLDQNGTVVTVTGPDGEGVDTGEPEVDGSVVTVPVDTDLPGTYTVAYEVMSADGHLVSGSLEFTVTVGNPPPSTSPSPTEEASPAAVATTEPSSPPEASSGEESSRPWWPFVVVGVMIVLGVVSSIELIRRRARTEP